MVHLRRLNWVRGWSYEFVSCHRLIKNERLILNNVGKVEGHIWFSVLQYYNLKLRTWFITHMNKHEWKPKPWFPQPELDIALKWLLSG